MEKFNEIKRIFSIQINTDKGTIFLVPNRSNCSLSITKNYPTCTSIGSVYIEEFKIEGELSKEYFIDGISAV